MEGAEGCCSTCEIEHSERLTELNGDDYLSPRSTASWLKFQASPSTLDSPGHFLKNELSDACSDGFFSTSAFAAGLAAGLAAILAGGFEAATGFLAAKKRSERVARETREEERRTLDNLDLVLDIHVVLPVIVHHHRLQSKSVTALRT